jgi:Trk K+ transport system NAD-binding subunit
MNETPPQSESTFLICGLGSLGQYCVSVLKEFGVKVIAIELEPAKSWEITDFPDLIDELVLGDCRQPKILEKAHIHQCRTILLVASDEQVNVEAAFAARSINSKIRIVIRSAQQNLNQLLAQELGNFVAFEPTQLPAAAFAFAALGSETIGFFNFENRLLRVIREDIQPDHPWCRIPLHELNRSTRRILSCTSEATRSADFYQWEPDTKLKAGDRVIYIESKEERSTPSKTATRKSRGQFWQGWRNLNIAQVQQQFLQFWQPTNQNRTRQVAAVCGVTVLVLFVSGIFVFRSYYPELSLQDAFFATAILLLGGYGDLFGQVQPKPAFPWMVQLFWLSLALAGTAFVGVLYALLTESLLTANFQLMKRRPPIPERDHIVLIGLGRVGQRIATLLQEFKQPIAAINSTDLDPGILPQLPLIVGNPTGVLNRVNLETAKSVIIVTDDEVKNLELALMSRAVNPNARLVLRVFHQHFQENLTRLLPQARVLGAYALAAEVFAAAAFGENILGLFRLSDQTILATEYQVEDTDSLNGQLLAEVAYGYGVVPIFHQKSGQEERLMPSDDVRLQVGDRLVILATIEGLQRIERGTRAARLWLVRIQSAVSKEAIFEGVRAIARVSGCGMDLAQSVMDQLPTTLPLSLYKHQAQRLVRELTKAQVTAYLQQVTMHQR